MIALKYLYLEERKKNATNLFTGIKTDPAEEKNCFSGIFVAENKLFSAEK
jgi:hypothetical protein